MSSVIIRRADQAVAPPSSRRDRISAMRSGDDLLLYDMDTFTLHKLEPITAAVWEACDGIRTVEDLGRDISIALGFSVGCKQVELALSELDRVGLLASPGYSRQRFSRRAAVKAAIVGTAVVSASIPASAAADSLDGMTTGDDVNTFMQIDENDPEQQKILLDAANESAQSIETVEPAPTDVPTEEVTYDEPASGEGGDVSGASSDGDASEPAPPPMEESEPVVGAAESDTTEDEPAETPAG